MDGQLMCGLANVQMCEFLYVDIPKEFAHPHIGKFAYLAPYFLFSD